MSTSIKKYQTQHLAFEAQTYPQLLQIEKEFKTKIENIGLASYKPMYTKYNVYIHNYKTYRIKIYESN